jgi:preprotein translocase subunit SecE
MGSFFSKSLQQSPGMSGNHNIIWIDNGPMFDMSAIFNQTIQNTVEEFEKVVIAKYTSIIINFMSILVIIILPIIFEYVRHHYQELSPKTDFNSSSLNNSDKSSASNGTSLSKNISSYAGG